MLTLVVWRLPAEFPWLKISTGHCFVHYSSPPDGKMGLRPSVPIPLSKYKVFNRRNIQGGGTTRAVQRESRA